MLIMAALLFLQEPEGNFENIAPYLKHPLVLTGVGMMLVFGLYNSLLKSGLLSNVKSN
jgi:hypothetical protein